MPQLTWTVLNGATDITSKVMSMNITQGREKYFDTYSGGSCTFTIDNTNDYAQNIVYGNIISVSTDGPNEFICYFWVQEVDFQDHPGNTGLNLATITAVDWISRSGRVFANALVLPEALCSIQFDEFTATAGGPLPADMLYDFTVFTDNSVASATTYTGSVNNYLNLLAMTERGYIVLRENYLTFVQRSYVGSFPPIATTLGPTASTTQIAYDTFDRIQNGLQFVNTATISPEGLTEQTSVNTTSLTAYGPASYSASTVDYTEAQASGNADWIATNFSEPATLRFRCSLSDRGQDPTALSAWMLECWGDSNPVNSISYQVPGGSLTSVQVFMEGFTINVTPEQTRFELNLSPLQYYQFFILDDPVFGMLGGSGIVYNQPEISYDETGWTYNDANADDTAARLGW
jgi:hypothetical protein